MNWLKNISKVIPLVLLSLSSCDKMPENGKLDGQWQLMQWQDGTCNPVDMKNKRVYYSFQLSLLDVRQLYNSGQHFLTRFKHTGDSLYIYDYRVYQIDTLALPGQLESLGLEGTQSRFQVELLNDDNMILKSEKSRLWFRKY